MHERRQGRSFLLGFADPGIAHQSAPFKTFTASPTDVLRAIVKGANLWSAWKGLSLRHGTHPGRPSVSRWQRPDRLLMKANEMGARTQ